MSWNGLALPSLCVKGNVELCLTDRGKHTSGLNHYLWPWRNSRPEALPESAPYRLQPSRSRPSVIPDRGGENPTHPTGVGGAAALQDAPQARLWEAGGSVRVWRWEQEGRCDSGARRSPHTSWQLGEPASGEELLGQATNKPAQCPSHLHINTALCPLPGFQYLSAVETWLWHSSRAV